MEKLIKEIRKKAKRIGCNVRIMELCGTHSETVSENALRQILPPNIDLVSGPGCPVCVTPEEDVEAVCLLARSGIPIACYGDSFSLPGEKESLEKVARERGKIFPVYDIMEVVKLSQKNPNLVFWGIGFETTAVATAFGIKNGLKVFSSHKIFPPAIGALLADRRVLIDALINPGHVSAIIGTEPYQKFKIPQIVTGFSPQDVLLAVLRALEQIEGGRAEVENIYTRLVKKEGNKKARSILRDVFRTGDCRWRGLGEIKKSGLFVRKKYQSLDARKIYASLLKKIKKPSEKKISACRCAEVVRGIASPKDCSLFSKICLPESPKGACMVSREGACRIRMKELGN